MRSLHFVIPVVHYLFHMVFVWDSFEADHWIQACWLTLAPDLLFHAEMGKKSFWESPSLTFMGNLLARLVFSPHQETYTRFAHFSIADPPIHLTVWEIPYNGQLVCTLLGEHSALSSLWEHIHNILWESWAELCGMMVFSFCGLHIFHALFLRILDKVKRSNYWNTSTMKSIQLSKGFKRFSAGFYSSGQKLQLYKLTAIFLKTSIVKWIAEENMVGGFLSKEKP